MPWCTGCDRFLSPNTVLADGTCPTCHRPVDQPSTAAPPGGPGSPRERRHERPRRHGRAVRRCPARDGAHPYPVAPLAPHRRPRRVPRIPSVPGPRAPLRLATSAGPAALGGCATGACRPPVALGLLPVVREAPVEQVLARRRATLRERHDVVGLEPESALVPSLGTAPPVEFRRRTDPTRGALRRGELAAVVRDVGDALTVVQHRLHERNCRQPLDLGGCDRSAPDDVTCLARVHMTATRRPGRPAR